MEELILSGLVHDASYSRRVLPHLKAEYFGDGENRVVFEEIERYVHRYNAPPTKEALLVELSNMDNLPQKIYDNSVALVDAMTPPNKESDAWLIDKTEKFAQDKAVYNAIMKSVQIMDGQTNEGRGSIPKILSDALAVSFDSAVGHDFLEDSNERFAFYNRKEELISCDIDYLNEATDGGIPRKTLNIILAGTNVGKSLWMCHLASSYASRGYNVLYITMEMAQERIAQRIDANLLDVELSHLKELPQDAYVKKMERLKSKMTGKIVIKEFPTASAHAGHFKILLNELKLKKNFLPDVIMVDYLNICASYRIKAGSSANSYTIVKSIAEELRGLAVEHNAVLWSATQTTRDGYDSSELSLTDTSESFGLPATSDFFIGVVSNEQLAALNQYLVYQLKSRYSDVNRLRKFVVGVDRPKQRLYNTEASADISQNPQHVEGSGRPYKKTHNSPQRDEPVFDRTRSGSVGGKKSKFVDLDFGGSS